MGYLDAYGAGVDRRLRYFKIGIAAGLLLLILALVLYFNFRDYAEHRQVQRFFDRLRAGDHRGAYALWGCSEQNPCRDYSFEKFLEDWGPQSPYANAAAAQVVKSHSCDSGVIQIVRYPGDQEVKLWVDRNTDALSFAPWELKQIPNDTRTRFAAWMWEITRNCQPIIGP